MNYPVSLRHFGVAPFSRYSPRPDNLHIPGGLWLSDGSWQNVIIESIQDGKKGWHYKHLKYVTVFAVQPSASKEFLVIEDEPAMHQFADQYGDGRNNVCHPPTRCDECNHNSSIRCFDCFGLHIEWDRVREDYDGIAITPFQRNLSHRCGDPKFHWYRFDCASWCLWNEECFSQNGQNSLTGYDCNCSDLGLDSLCLGPSSP